MVLRLVRFIIGYVSFTAKGGFPERFINLCRQNRIDLWNLKSENSVLTACTDVYGYKKIRTCAKKSGMRVRLSRKYGLSFFLDRHSRRIGIIIGALFCAAALMMLSTRIWRIEVIGNDRIPSDAILSVFEELGVRKGAAISSVDEWTVEQAAIRRIPEISWVNINLMGSSAQIEVREVIEQKEFDDSSEPANIVAARDGQIVYLRPFEGTQEKKIGTGVVKGDLLISGMEELIDLSTRICRADGYVVARTEHRIESEAQTHITMNKAQTYEKSYAIEFLSFTIPPGKKNNGFEEKSSLYINGVTLPFSVCEYTEPVFAESEVTLEKEKALLLAWLEFSEKCAEEFRYMQVEKCEVKENITESGCKITGSFTVLENIGEVQPFEVVEN